MALHFPFSWRYRRLPQREEFRKQLVLESLARIPRMVSYFAAQWS